MAMMVRWLAAEALGDPALESSLYGLQEIEAKLRVGG
jgi:hypothetical protein